MVLSIDQEVWEGSYWDDFIRDFGLAEYIRERYERGEVKTDGDHQGS